MKIVKMFFSIVEFNAVSIGVCSILAILVYFLVDNLIWIFLPYVLILGFVYFRINGPINHIVRHKLGRLVENKMIYDSGVSQFDRSYIEEIKRYHIPVRGIGSFSIHFKQCETLHTNNEIILTLIDMPFSNVYVLPWNNISKVSKSSSHVSAKVDVLIEYTRDVYFINGQRISIPLSNEAYNFASKNVTVK